MSVYASHSDHYCGVNVPDETGKMSRSDKRGATLPKVATVALLLRNDGLFTVMLSVSDPLGRSPPLRHATRATSPASTGEHTPGRVVSDGLNIIKNERSA